MRVLSSVFSVSICAYSVMRNHYHMVVKLIPKESAAWSDDEVFRRWATLFRGPLLVQDYLAGKALSEIEQDSLVSMASVYRARLASLSWFMKCLNEPIARRANTEDECKGHFWEARFHSQPLYSKRSLLMAMAYVDLNPVRAGVASTPEESAFTSIRLRLQENLAGTNIDTPGIGNERANPSSFHLAAIRPLTAFAERTHLTSLGTARHVLPMYRIDYLKLVDATGRILVQGKRGRIDPALAPILRRLDIPIDDWLQGTTKFRTYARLFDEHDKAFA